MSHLSVSTQNNLLIKAAEKNNVDFFSSLVKKGIPSAINLDKLRNKYNRSLLEIAIVNRRPHIVKLLAKTRAIDILTASGATMLIRAAQGGYHENVAILINSHIVGKTYKKTGNTALMYAAAFGHAECVKLLSNTKEAGMQNAKGETALMLAAKAGHLKCVNILISAKEPGRKDKIGFTALMYAIKHERTECVKRLIDTKDLCVVNSYGWGALMFATRCGLIKYVHMLMKTNEIKIIDNKKRNALDIAKEYEREECVKLLS